MIENLDSKEQFGNLNMHNVHCTVCTHTPDYSNDSEGEFLSIDMHFYSRKRCSIDINWYQLIWKCTLCAGTIVTIV